MTHENRKHGEQGKYKVSKGNMRGDCFVNCCFKVKNEKNEINQLLKIMNSNEMIKEYMNFKIKSDATLVCTDV